MVVWYAIGGLGDSICSQAIPIPGKIYLYEYKSAVSVKAVHVWASKLGTYFAQVVIGFSLPNFPNQQNFANQRSSAFLCVHPVAVRIVKTSELCIYLSSSNIKQSNSCLP